MDDFRADPVNDQEPTSATDPKVDPPPGDLAVERNRLQSEIDTAKARAAAARERAAARELELRAVIHAEIVASRESIAEMERQHEMAIAMVRSAAQAEVERILAEAHRHADYASAGGYEERAATDAD